MELRHLRYFVVVAEEQNVTRAAERLHVSQPPLSRQIRDLEEELGVELFRRSAKSLALTEAGKIFLIEARAVLLRVDKAIETVRMVARRDRGSLRIGYAPSLTAEFLPRALRLFEAERPGVRVALHDLSSEECLQRIADGKLDLALTVPRRGLRDKGLFTPLVRHLPDRVWWAARLGKGGKDPVDALRRVVDHGASLFVILGPDEWPGIGRGREHELRQVARTGVFAITYVPTLDHSFHVASGRKDALTVLDEWILGTPDGTLVGPEGTKIIS